MGGWNQRAGTWKWAIVHLRGHWLWVHGNMVPLSSVMTTQSGMLPDRVSARLARPMMCTTAGVQGARRYLDFAHIKTQPEVVASSKLVPFEIQQTLPRWACVWYRRAWQARTFTESNPYIYHIHGQVCNVFQSPSVEVDQTPCKSEPPTNKWVTLRAVVHLHAVANALSLELKTNVWA